MATESNIAYVLVDMLQKDGMNVAHFQIDQLKKIKPRAWFVDIVCAGPMLAEAMHIKALIATELEQLNPWQQYGGEAVTAEINVAPIKGMLKARQTMVDKINGAKAIGRAENVKIKDPTGKELPIEY